MKRITRIFISFCLMLLLTEGVKGQSVRFGFEGNYGIGPYYNYDLGNESWENDGAFISKDYKMLVYSVNFYTDIIFPRRWTPNWMALSMQVGLGFMQMNYNDNYFYNLFGAFSDDYLSRGANIPVNFEVKFLLSDDMRFFINCGAVNYMAISQWDYSRLYGYFSDGYGLDVRENERFYMLGYNYGFGFEFGFFRVGYKLTNMAYNILKIDIGNRHDNIHTISAGIMFNGNRFLKKKSHLKVY